MHKSAKNNPANKEKKMRFVTCRPQSSDVLYRFFDDEFLSKLSAERAWPVALDVIEEKEQYILKADLPGINKEDIKVSVENGLLTIEGERKSEIEQKDKQVHRIERSYGRFTRSLNLGAHVDTAKIKANYKDGVLELIVPKSEETKPKSIDIHVD
jgi:HSP20 family protein